MIESFFVTKGIYRQSFGHNQRIGFIRDSVLNVSFLTGPGYHVAFSWFNRKKLTVQTVSPLTRRSIMPTECLCKMCGESITDPDFRVVLCQEEYPEIEIGPYCESCLARIKICSGCQYPFHMDHTTHTGNGEHYCSSCISNLTVCECCSSKVVGDQLVEANGSKICKKCFEREYFFCKSCNSYHKKDEAIQKSSLLGMRKAGIFRKYGEMVCIGCYDKRSPHFKTYKVCECQHCGRNYSLSGSYTSEKYCQNCYSGFYTCSFCGEKKPNVESYFVDNTRRLSCGSCRNKELERCDCCGSYTQLKTHTIRGKLKKNYTVCNMCKDAKECKHCGKLSNDSVCVQCKMCYTENTCSECGRVRDDSGNCRVCHYSKIYNYSFKPRKWFNTLDNDKTTDILFGFENEVSYKSSKSKMEAGLKILYSFYDPTVVVAKSDSTIEGNGYEIVSQPMSLAFFNQLPLGGMFSEGIKGSATCGLHIHVGRGAFLSDVHLYKVCNFLLENRDFSQYVAGRTFNNYCKSFSGKSSSEIVRAKKFRDTERHQAVNLQNRDTVEFRLFAGCTSEDQLRGRVEFLHALITYMRGTAISKAKDVGSFIKYVTSNQKVYPYAGDIVKTYELH